MKADIIFLQETFVVSDYLGILYYVNESYNSIGVYATYSESSMKILSCRPMGGLAILCRKIIDLM